MGTIPGLDELLAALRVEGVPVGPVEVVRIQHSLAAMPRLDRDGLRRLLACLLVKRSEHQRPFEQLFDQWCPDIPAQEWLAARERHGTRPQVRAANAPGAAPTATVAAGEKGGPPKRRRRVSPKLALLAAAACASALAVWLLSQDWWKGRGGDIQVTPPAEEQVRPPAEETASEELPSQPAPYIRFWQARVDPEAIAVPPRIGPEGLLGLGLLFALAAAYLAYRHYSQGRLRPVALPPTRGGPGWMPLPAPRGSDTFLTDGRERRGMSWNIARFTAEDQTRRMDEAATAAATARAGGLTEVRYRHVKYPREVWLWRDSHTETPELEQLLREVETSLQRGGLRVRVGTFPGVLTQVWWRKDAPFSPATEDGHRDQVMVAILTDGAGLLRALRAPARRAQVAHQLRNLALWPHIAVVDFSGAGALARSLAPFHLPRIAPRELPGWLGGRAGGTVRGAPLHLQGDLRVWAGSCAFCEDGVDEAAAQRLRSHLRLACDPWQVADLRRHAAGPSLVWAPETRRWLVNDLLGMGFDTRTGSLDRDSLAQRAIEWWIEHYRQAQKEQSERENDFLPWTDSAAERHWALEIAMLQLYLDPETAVPDLTALAAAGMRAEVRRRLRGLRTWDMERERANGLEENTEGARDWREQAVYLPWRWQDYGGRPELLDALHRLGFGGKQLLGRLRFHPPSRSALALGTLAGLALAAFAAAGYWYLEPPGIRLVPSESMLDQPALRAQTLRRVDDGAGSVVVGHAKAAEVLREVPAGAQVPIAWSWGDEASKGEGGKPLANNPVVPYEDSSGLLFRGGMLAEPVRPCDPDWPPRSLAVIQADPDPSQEARRLAIQLLDSGSADLVLVGEEWRTDLQRLPQRQPRLDRETQLLVFVPPDAEAPRAVDWPGPWALVSADYRTAAQRLSKPEHTGILDLSTIPELRPLAGPDPDPHPVRLHAGPDKVTDPATGITWIRLCSGTFTMGTADTDPKEAVGMKQEDEQPAHRVSLSAFEIAETEVTNAQYRRLVPDHDQKAAAELPAVYVTWQQARKFCRARGGDLPTEAQWEYAARAGSPTPWSFGSDEKRLARYAWYGEDFSKSQVHPVAAKDPNPFGLYDVHGNAWEWARDWYGPYSAESQLDPSGSDSGQSRVLRGGSFFNSPVFLRSADRVGGLPGGWFRVSGFRCVRVPARQH